jgi:hypothetical protein
VINELFLYDRDNGLFQSIIKQSIKLTGKYHLCPNYGYELDSANLDQYIQDPLTGLTAVDKFPCCACLPPESRLLKLNQQKGESMMFHLYFLTPAGRTGKNQIKAVNRSTNTSSTNSWDDWEEMKVCAVSFLEVLYNTLLKGFAGETKLTSIFHLNYEGARIRRLTKFTTSSLNGVSLTFNIDMLLDVCTIGDYSIMVLPNAQIPTNLNA